MTETGVVVLYFSATIILFMTFDVFSKFLKNKAPSQNERDSTE